RHTKYGATVRNARVCIAVFLDEKSCYNRTKDLQAVGACMQNMLLAAHALGLGGVWLGEIINQREAVEKELGVKHELMAVIALGRPVNMKRTSERKTLEEIVLG
ncbi:MAG: nitroreductase family protein, partial [Candidatus Altiarchaeota archaeon]|nr:nitroreductase family protein [Candidatus Altiarchaeota archaeon]